MNANTETTSGLDFQSDYTTNLFNGNLALHLVGNYTDTQTISALGFTYERAGSLSGATPGGFTGNVKLKFNLSATYTEGAWSGTVQGRFLGPAHLSGAWQNGIQVDNNDIPWVGYLDLRGSYKWNDNMTFYTSINNVNNAPPPNIPTATGVGGNNTQIYDGQGRTYSGGLRISY